MGKLYEAVKVEPSYKTDDSSRFGDAKPPVTHQLVSLLIKTPAERSAPNPVEGPAFQESVYIKILSEFATCHSNMVPSCYLIIIDETVSSVISTFISIADNGFTIQVGTDGIKVNWRYVINK